MNIAVRHEKKPFLSTSLTTNSSFQFLRNFRAFGGAQSASASIPLHLRNPSLMNNHFLDTLPSSSYSSNSFTHLLFSFSHVFLTFNFAPITSSDLYNIFKRIRLTSPLRFLISLVACSYCASITVLISFSTC